MRKRLLAVMLSGARLAAAQEEEEGARLYPLLSVGAARAVAATLADRDATGTLPNTGGVSVAYREAFSLRLRGQWGIIAEARVPLGARKVWGVEAYGARFRGDADATAIRQVANPGPPPTLGSDAVHYRLRGVTSWRGTLGVARAFPLPARLTGAALLGATWGTVRAAADDCIQPVVPPAPGIPLLLACPPALDLDTPGVTVGADVFTRPWRSVRLRFSAKSDVLRVDEAEVRRAFEWNAFASAPVGEGSRRWATLPSFTVGVEFAF